MTWTDVFVVATAAITVLAILFAVVVVWSAGAMSHPSNEHKRAVKGLRDQWERDRPWRGRR